jgi:hypothetical protein
MERGVFASFCLHGVCVLAVNLALGNTIAGNLESKLFEAVSRDNLEKVRSLLADGANVNVVNADGASPLMLAADGSEPNIVEILIDAGADPNARDVSGLTVLMRAINVDFIVDHKYLRTINALLDAGADVNAQDQRGLSALQHACIGHASTGTLEIDGRLTITGPPGGKAVLETVYVEVVHELLLHGADVNQRTTWGGTALMAAATAGYKNVIDVLLRAGADINAADNTGLTSLMIAADEGHEEIFMFLSASGANMNGIFERVGEQGDAETQATIGFAYYNGQGIEKDFEKAAEWFRMAAEQGHAVAQHNLGFMYLMGEGIAKNDEAAVKWFRMAAEQGYAVSQKNLGVLYSEGLGVPQDKAKAYAWLTTAKAQGHDVREEALQELLDEMTRGELRRAKELAREYRERYIAD